MDLICHVTSQKIILKLLSDLNYHADPPKWVSHADANMCTDYRIFDVFFITLYIYIYLPSVPLLLSHVVLNRGCCVLVLSADILLLPKVHTCLLISDEYFFVSESLLASHPLRTIGSSVIVRLLQVLR